MSEENTIWGVPIKLAILQPAGRASKKKVPDWFRVDHDSIGMLPEMDPEVEEDEGLDFSNFVPYESMDEQIANIIQKPGPLNSGRADDFDKYARDERIWSHVRPILTNDAIQTPHPLYRSVQGGSIQGSLDSKIDKGERVQIEDWKQVPGWKTDN